MEQVCACELEIENEGQSLRVCALCVCLSAPMRQDLQSVKWSREDFSRDTLQHISPSLSFALSPIQPPSTPSSLCLHFSVLPFLLPFQFPIPSFSSGAFAPCSPSLTNFSSFPLPQYLFVVALFCCFISQDKALPAVVFVFPPARSLSYVWMPCMCRIIERET